MTIIDLINSVQALLPEIFLALASAGLLIAGVMREKGRSPRLYAAGAVILLIAAVLCLLNAGLRFDAFNGMVAVTPFSTTIKLTLLIAAAMVLVMSQRPFERQGGVAFEYPVLVLLAVLGMMLMVGATHLLVFYVALELQSLCLYVMAAIRRDHLLSAEAGLKYFVLGALSSGMMLFGASLIYGNTGSLSFDVIANTLVDGGPNASLAAIIGLVFVLSGFAFKISAVPFHMWTPDVYHGAPTPVTAFFAVVPKLAAMGFLMALLSGPFMIAIDHWGPIIMILSAASMIWGALAGLIQRSLKRLIAYSSIGSVGYALMGLVAASPEGMAATLFYMIVYMIMTVGIFALLMTLESQDGPLDRITDLAGLSKTYPMAAYGLMILLFSLSGLPPLAGFIGKFMVFQAVIAQGWFILATIGVVSSVIASFYYLRLIKIMFFDAPHDATVCVPGRAACVVAGLSIVVILGLILVPSPLADWTLWAVRSLFFV